MEGDPNYEFLTDAQFNKLISDDVKLKTPIEEGHDYYFIQKSTVHRNKYTKQIYGLIIRATIRRIDDGKTPSPFGTPYPEGMAVVVTDTNNDTPNYGKISRRNKERRVSGLGIGTGMRINNTGDWIAIKDVEINKTGTRIGSKIVKTPKIGAADSYVDTGSEVPSEPAKELRRQQRKLNEKEREKTLKAVFKVTNELVVNTTEGPKTVPVGTLIRVYGGFNSEACFHEEHRDDEELIDDMGAPYNNIGTGCFSGLEYDGTDGKIYKIPHLSSYNLNAKVEVAQIAPGRTRKNRRKRRKTRRT
jgi:hypothetical protein